MNRIYNSLRFAVIAACLLPATACQLGAQSASKETSGSGFELNDRQGQHLTVLLNGRPVARYMYAHDTTSDQRHHETYKPYLHVYDASGEAPITKGAGGRFTHHRGIFIGWNRIEFEGDRFDRWHMKGGDIVHQSFTSKQAEKDEASMVSLTHWEDGEEEAMIEEQRAMTFRRGPGAAYLEIDFKSTLHAPRSAVKLEGDPEHAGIQFRPADEVTDSETRYFFPTDNADPRDDRDYPWVGESFMLNGKRYSVVHMNHSSNPKNTRYSAYRDYGRFGAFFETEIEQGGSLSLKYRFLIVEGEMPSKEWIDTQWKKFAGE